MGHKVYIFPILLSPTIVGGAKSGWSTPKNNPEIIETIAAPAMIFVIVSSVFASIAEPKSYSSPGRAPKRFAFLAE